MSFPTQDPNIIQSLKSYFNKDKTLRDSANKIIETYGKDTSAADFAKEVLNYLNTNSGTK